MQTHFNFNDIVYQHFNQLDHSILSMRVLTFKYILDSVEDYARHWAKHATDDFWMGEECWDTDAN